MAIAVKPFDGSSYSANVDPDSYHQSITTQNDAQNEGVLFGWDDGFLISGVASPIDVTPGRAFVNGKEIISTAHESVNIATPATSTRVDLIVLEVDYVAKTANAAIVRVAGTEGAGAPAATWTPGTKVQLPIGTASITTGGVVTCTPDPDRFLYFATKVSQAMLDDGILTNDAAGHLKMVDGYLSADAAGRAKMADGFVTVDELGNNALAASAAGRGKLADGFFTADATGQAKFAAGFLTADAGGRALMADNFVTVDELAHSIDAQPIGLNADKLDGYHSSDIIAGGVITGAIMMWFGTIGGSDGHRPIVGGSANEDWHICNGDLVGAVQTPDMAGRMPIGVNGTYTIGLTGGAASTNFSHWHAAGTLALNSHSHGSGTLTNSITGTEDLPGETVQSGTGKTVADNGHTHPGSVISGDVTPTVGVTLSGLTANGLSTINTMPPYLALYYIMKIA